MRLREHRAQPAFQRAAAAIIGKLRDSRALAIISAIKVGIDRAREFASFGVFARDAECCVMQLLPIAEHEVFPGLLVSSSAGTGKGKLIHAKAEIEISNSCFINIGGEISLSNGKENGGKILFVHSVLARFALFVQRRQQGFQLTADQSGMGAATHRLDGNNFFDARCKKDGQVRSSNSQGGKRNAPGEEELGHHARGVPCTDREGNMKTKLLFAVVTALVAISMLLAGRIPAKAGEMHSASGYKVLAPIRHGNLTVFPVVAQKAHDTGDFLTLDEGLRSGDVVVSEYGSVRPMIRRRTPQFIPNPSGGAEVNRLVPAESDPIDLGVFCVEPGRWVGTSSKFGAGYGGGVVPMAAPGVRSKAMADKDQTKVWAEVRRAQNQAAAGIAGGAPTAAETVEVQSTTS